MSESILIVGAGGHAVSVANVAIGSNFVVIAFIDDNEAGSELLGIPVIAKEHCLEQHQAASFAIAIGDNATREAVSREYQCDFPLAKFPPVIHRSAVIGANSRIGEGTVVMPQANIGPNSLVSSFCIINTSSSVDHDCVIRPYSSIAPKVATGGNVTIGCRSAISIGATIMQGISVGDDTVIGANSYVNHTIDNNVVAYGSPCKVVRSRAKTDTYLF